MLEMPEIVHVENRMNQSEKHMIAVAQVYLALLWPFIFMSFFDCNPDFTQTGGGPLMRRGDYAGFFSFHLWFSMAQLLIMLAMTMGPSIWLFCKASEERRS